ncbi:MAG: putative oxidoreductase [Streptosporangiaceae bacterium]|jgi:putative oxidoreductase|nr:DoxX family protein [Streptosporangiaceae bacterium]MDX6428488.1 putative oxidoreductase [Streptosporangiaceae bacterium]
MRTRPLYDVVALLARVGVGVVFIAHGWQKIQVGVTATAHSFDHLGVPLPTAAAVYATFVELLGGAALILGLGLPVAGVLLFADMLGAFVFVNAEHGLFVTDQGVAKEGFELVLMLGLASLLFATGAGGRLTLDSRIFPRRAADTEVIGKRATAKQVRGKQGTDKQVTGEQAADGAASEAVGPASAGAAPAGAPTKSLPSGTETMAETPRLASDIVDDTTRDTLVAGRKRPRKPTGGNA